MKKQLLISALSAICILSSYATNFQVTNNSDSGAGSLRQAITDANADATATPTAPHTITTDGPYTLTLLSALPAIAVPTNVNASGTNVLTINVPANLNTACMSVANSTTGVTLNYLTLQNATAKAGSTTEVKGGALFIGQTTGVTINHCSFLNNQISTNGFSASLSGAAIYISANVSPATSTFAINDSRFEGNKLISNYNGTPALAGSAIYSGSGCALTITNTLFKTNSAEFISPAISLTGGSLIRAYGNMTCTRCTFDGNSAATGGSGTVFFTSQAITVNLDRCVVKNNSCYNGAPIHLSSLSSGLARLNITNSILADNANNSATVGGGVIFAAADVSITNSQISGNSACQGGGVMLNVGNNTTYKSKLTMTNCTVSDNYTNGQNQISVGGGVFVKGGSTALTDNCTFTNCTFSGNSTSSGTTTSTGGGVNFGNGSSATWAAQGTFNNCTFVGNTTNGNIETSAGGGIQRDGTAIVILNYCLLANNNSNSTQTNLNVAGSGALMGSTTGRNLVGVALPLFSYPGATETTGGVTFTGDITTLLNTTLTDNGGSTALPDGSYVKTHALVAGGSAINPTAALGIQTNDQRGFNRDATPDIGAFEFGGTITNTALQLIEKTLLCKVYVKNGNLNIAFDEENTVDLTVFDGVGRILLKSKLSKGTTVIDQINYKGLLCIKLSSNTKKYICKVIL